MKLIVNSHNIEIEKSPINEKEINITKIQFEFCEEITSDYVKEAYFTFNNETYKQIISNDECNIPYEVLAEKGQIEIGVVAFLVENEEEIKRYNPSPVYINTWVGSLKEEFENSEPVTPSDKEQIEQMLNNINVDANKEGKITTITITFKDGTTKDVTLEDGMGIDYNWVGTQLGIKREDEQEYEYVDLKGDTGPAGAIKMLIVNQLPTTGEEGTLYFVPKQDTETSDIYDEYMWVNNDWERLGEKQIVVDLSDYYKKQEVNNLLDEKADVEDIPDLSGYVKNTDYATSSKGGVVKIDTNYNGVNVGSSGFIFPSSINYATYQTKENNFFISKGTLENVITGKELVNKTYVDGLVGDISNALDTINGESVGD